ncbi:Fumarate lyase [Penicillium angulare]|uniref:Fumarate lyase n=1 Tax=Penicillium angulare TaxID=116970 RepID=A0A9W9F3D1_9EURO|nr:Fumarate lyase [Penicillium angulare]
MAVSALDSRIFRNLFGTQEIRDIFAEDTYVKCLVDVEAALARSQSKTGVIPSDAGDAITDALDKIQLDYDRLARETDVVGYPVLPLVCQLVERTPNETSKFIHWGATTQDIMDNASMLQIKRGLILVERELQTLKKVLTGLATTHRDTPMAGRTHLQHALPCTFGYKCAVYLSGILRHLERVEEIKQRCLLVQFGGAAGTIASLGPDDTGLRVREQLAIELGLHNPAITWHVARDNIAEVTNFLALIGGTLGKIALDLMVMSSNEFDEVSEPFVPHRGASSTMPQKRNPISSEVILAASKMLRVNASLGLDAMVTDFERASGPWHLEWVAVPDSFVTAVGALHQTNFVMAGLVVKTDSMERNLHSTRGLIVGEAVMMALAPHIGRQKAHDEVYEACKSAIEQNQSLLQVLQKSSVLTGVFTPEQLTRLCDPLQYMGASQLMVDEMIKRSGLSVLNKDDLLTNGH